VNDLNIIDRFMETFIRYIDSGFGLLSSDVAFLTTILIGIDITLAGLFWALGGEDNILGRLIRKVLYVGVFALILNNFRSLSDIIYRSFAGLGLNASASSLTPADLLKPGRLAGTGFEAAYPMIQQVGKLLGFPEVFANLLTIFVLLVAWLIVVIAFFILAIQLFITILEFKLTTLAGFVLVPFALWNKTAFLAERVLGTVISSGIKVMVLGMIVGIGSTLFGALTSGLRGQEPDLVAAMSQVLGALSLLALSIYGPAIAAGLVSGAPQLGAGAALGTAGVAFGATLVAGGAALAGARMVTGRGLAAIRAGTTIGSAASSAYRLRAGTSGATGITGVAAGVGGVARAAGGAVAQGIRSATGRATDSLRQSADRGRGAAWLATGGAPTSGTTAAASAAATTPTNSTPDWARRLRAQQATRAHRHAAAQAVRDGDRPGQGANPSLTDKDE
jgi:type IV secretion system protein TrbL